MFILKCRRHTVCVELPKCQLKEAIKRAEHMKAVVRFRVEHPLWVVRRQRGYPKVHIKGLLKNTARVLMLFVSSSLRMTRRTLLVFAGDVRL